MQENLIKQFLEAGVHFGHQARRWNPKMKSFVFGEKGGVHIIDLQKTAQSLDTACSFLRQTVASGGYILFVGTKKQAQEIIQQEAKRCFMFYVNYRWLGGTLTNFQTIRKSIEKMKLLRQKKEDVETDKEKLNKKELARLNKELDKLQKNLCGIEGLQTLPAALFIIDSKREEIAIREAKKLGIPVVAVIDTNCDPDEVDYPIPANDDAIRSIKLITSLIADSILEGYQEAAGKGQKIKKMEAGQIAAEEVRVSVSAKEGEGIKGEIEKTVVKEVEQEVEKEVEKEVRKKKVKVKEKIKDKGVKPEGK